MSNNIEVQLKEVTNHRINCRRLLIIYKSHIEYSDVKNCIVNNSKYNEVLCKYNEVLCKYKELIVVNRDEITFAAIDFGEKFINKKTKDLTIFDCNGITPIIYPVNSPAHWSGLMTQLGVD